MPSCSAVCSADDNVYEGNCGFFSQKDDKRWCINPYNAEESCCAFTSDDCCYDDDGRIAGVIIAIIVAIILNCIACCYCCKCCCFKQVKEIRVYPAQRPVDAHYRRRRR